MPVRALIKMVKHEGSTIIVLAQNDKRTANEQLMTFRIVRATWKVHVGETILDYRDFCVIEESQWVPSRRIYRRDLNTGDFTEDHSEIPVSNLGEPHLVFEVDEFHITSWSAGKVGEGVPATQVHLLWNIAELNGVINYVVIRFKSKKGLDRFIADLIEHRDYVWPDKPNGE
jgi:hypothetical protein